MRNAYIVKSTVTKNPLRPTERVSYKEFEQLVDMSNKLTWLENTKHGKRWHERNETLKEKNKAYLNIIESDEKSFVQLYHSKRGFITVQFDYKSTNDNLHDLIDLAHNIGCNLWQYSPKRQVLTHEIVKNRYKRSKARAKNSSQIHFPKNWLYIQSSTEEELLDKFSIYNNLEFAQIKATASTLNKNISGDSIVSFRTNGNGYFVLGSGIDNLFYSSFSSKAKQELKQLMTKYDNRMSKLFPVFQLKATSSEDEVKQIEKHLIEQLNSLVANKETIHVAKVRKKLF